MALLPFSSSITKLKAFSEQLPHFHTSSPLPVLFLGHGSPMNAIEENEFVQGFRKTAKSLPTPQAILCISAHWETKGTWVTAMQHPKTIHDFGGFPKALFDVEYPAPGSPELAKLTTELIHGTAVHADEQWGLDHGAWTVIKHLYPQANIPVVQMSIDNTKDARFHYELGRELAVLRRKGVLIIGSGNMVHNLGKLAWDKLQSDNFGFEWALDASAHMKNYILNRNHQPLIQYQSQGTAFQWAIPTPEHYLPLLYVLALQERNDQVSLFNDKAVGGSLTMTSVRIDAAS